MVPSFKQRLAAIDANAQPMMQRAAGELARIDWIVTRFVSAPRGEERRLAEWAGSFSPSIVIGETDDNARDWLRGALASLRSRSLA